jgi:hypothetical protein
MSEGKIGNTLQAAYSVCSYHSVIGLQMLTVIYYWNPGTHSCTYQTCISSYSFCTHSDYYSRNVKKDITKDVLHNEMMLLRI